MYTNAKVMYLRLFVGVLFIIAASVILTGCSSETYNGDSNNSTTATNDACYISSCYFGNLRIPHVVKASDGVTDSTYYTTYVPDNKYLTIDQKLLFVQNRDSVAKNTDLSKVPMYILFTGSHIEWRKSDTFEEDEWTTFNSGDSLDLRAPLLMRVSAVNGDTRVYTLKVNIHLQDGNELVWNIMPTHTGLSGTNPMRMATTPDGVIALVNDRGNIVAYTHRATNTGQWTIQSCPSLPDKTDVMTLVNSSDALYVNTTDGNIYKSTDGIQWSQVGTLEGARLLGTSEYLLYALKNGTVFSARLDQPSWNTADWLENELDDLQDLLPCENLAFVHYAQNVAQHRAVLMGYTPDDDNHLPMDAIVWSKAWSHFDNEGKEQLIHNENDEEWMMYSRTWDDLWQMPMLKNLQLVYYNDKLMAIGGENPYNPGKSLEGIYESEDNGLTWRITGNINLPANLGTGNSICWIVDNDNFLWLAVDGKIYRGRLNKLGFDRQ